jgi:hypothetical protein
MAVIPGEEEDGGYNSHSKDYILVHFLTNGEECPMSELQSDLDRMNGWDIGALDEEHAHDTDIPLE